MYLPNDYGVTTTNYCLGIMYATVIVNNYNRGSQTKQELYFLPLSGAKSGTQKDDAAKSNDLTKSPT